jgi:hypothetical protein
VHTSVRSTIGRFAAAAAATGTALLLPATPASAAGLQAVDDSATIGSIDMIAPIDLLANDIGPDGQPATPGTVGVDTTPVRGPARGTVVISSNGTAVYTPGPCSAGTDSFGYRIVDPQQTSSTSAATVTVTILPAAAGVDARPDRFRADAGGAAQGSLLTNDCGPGPQASPSSVLVDADPVGQPAKGAVLINPGAGTFIYQANPGANGTDSFGYRISNPETPSLTDTARVTIVLPAPAPAPPPVHGFNPPPAANPPPAGNVNPPAAQSQPAAPQLPGTGAPMAGPAALLGVALLALGTLLLIVAGCRRAARG